MSHPSLTLMKRLIEEAEQAERATSEGSRPHSSSIDSTLHIAELVQPIVFQYKDLIESNPSQTNPSDPISTATIKPKG